MVGFGLRFFGRYDIIIVVELVWSFILISPRVFSPPASSKFWRACVHVTRKRFKSARNGIGIIKLQNSKINPATTLLIFHNKIGSTMLLMLTYAPTAPTMPSNSTSSFHNTATSRTTYLPSHHAICEKNRWWIIILFMSCNQNVVTSLHLSFFEPTAAFDHSQLPLKNITMSETECIYRTS